MDHNWTFCKWFLFLTYDDLNRKIFHETVARPTFTVDTLPVGYLCSWVLMFVEFLCSWCSYFCVVCMFVEFHVCGILMFVGFLCLWILCSCFSVREVLMFVEFLCLWGSYVCGVLMFVDFCMFVGFLCSRGSYVRVFVTRCQKIKSQQINY